MDIAEIRYKFMLPLGLPIPFQFDLRKNNTFLTLFYILYYINRIKLSNS